MITFYMKQNIRVIPLEKIEYTNHNYKTQSRSNLKKTLVEVISRLQDPVIHDENKLFDTSDHIDYLCNYLIYKDETGFHVGTIIVEFDYISHAYMVDYSKYYSRSFQKHETRCTRIHFFNDHYFDEDHFKEQLLLNDSESEGFWKSYLGYIVIKPLLNSMIGATLLRHYNYVDEKNSKQRTFPALRDYEVNVFGRKISIETLIYQQQDKVVSACATSALWMSLNKACNIFNRMIPAPIEITTSAGNGHEKGRNFPNTGLDINQVLRAISHISLVSEVRTATTQIDIWQNYRSVRILDVIYLKRLIFSYLNLGVPVLLGYRTTNGLHMVTVVGFRFTKNKTEVDDIHETSIKIKADQIQRLFVHDDQLGVFCKIGFKKIYEDFIQVRWVENKYDLAHAYCVVVPIRPVIRIKYEDIYGVVECLDPLFSSFKEEKNDFTWNIYLSTSNQFKEKIRDDDKIDPEKRVAIITAQLPKYIWMIECELDSILFELVFDATDYASNLNCEQIIFFDHGISELLENIITKNQKEFKIALIEYPKLTAKLLSHYGVL